MRFLLYFFSGVLVAQNPSGILDPARYADWTKAGAGPIPSVASRTQCGATLNSSSTAAQVNTALANCNGTAGSPAYVKLGAGTFTFSAQIAWSKSYVSLVGSGPDQTIINGTAGTCGESHSAVICVAGGTDMDGTAPNNAGNVVVGAKGATTIQLGTQTTGTHKPAVGDVIEINQSQDTTDQWPNITYLKGSPYTQGAGNAADGTPYSGSFQMVRVTSITAGTCTGASPCTVGIDPPILMHEWGTRATMAQWSNNPSVLGAGIESLRVQGSNPSVGFRWAALSWVRNWESVNTSGATAPKQIFLNHTTQITVRDSYIYGGGTSQDEYAIDCYGCASTLVENNIFQALRMGYAGEMATGAVIAYNYFVDDPTGQNNHQGISNNHGCCNGFDLIEGNDAMGAVPDNYYGQALFTTQFRNRMWGIDARRDTWGSQGTLWPAMAGPRSRYANFVGNVLGTIGFHNIYQTNSGSNWGNANKSIYVLGMGGGGAADDSNTALSTMRWCNWDVFQNSGSGATKCDLTEVPTTAIMGTSKYAVNDGANGVNLSAHNVNTGGTLPASFYLASKPSWWSSAPWPAIGPDITGGNLTNSGGHANKIPARIYFEAHGGTFGGAPITFNADGYYAGGAPAVGLDSSSHNFGSHMVGVQSVGFTFNLTNTGSTVLSISSISPSGDFAYSSNCPISPSTLGIGSSCTIIATFTPTAIGSRSGSILIADNAADSPQTIGLSGTGLPSSAGSSGTGISAGQVIIR